MHLRDGDEYAAVTITDTKGEALGDRIRDQLADEFEVVRG
jgi:hypothetical protein